MNAIARMYYETALDNFKTRLNTISTKEKRHNFQEEITTLKMLITLIENLLKETTWRN